MQDDAVQAYRRRRKRRFYRRITTSSVSSSILRDVQQPYAIPGSGLFRSNTNATRMKEYRTIPIRFKQRAAHATCSLHGFRRHCPDQCFDKTDYLLSSACAHSIFEESQRFSAFLVSYYPRITSMLYVMLTTRRGLTSYGRQYTTRSNLNIIVFLILSLITIYDDAN